MLENQSKKNYTPNAMLTFRFPALLSLAGLREDERASRRAIRDEERRFAAPLSKDYCVEGGVGEEREYSVPKTADR